MAKKKKMDPLIRAKWVEALRSGEYKQGIAALRSCAEGRSRKRRDATTRFCCLGVLCNLHAMAHPEIAQKETSPYAYLGNAYALPSEVSKWAGLNSGNPTVTYNGALRPLADVNDYGVPFTRIADLIDEQF